MQPDSAAAGTYNTGSSPVQWTSVTHNDLFVPSPVKPAAGSGSAHPEQQDQQQQLIVLGPSSPSSWAGEASTAMVVLPDSAMVAASPAAQHARAVDLQQVQDAALQQVLGVGLQELHHGGMEVSLQLLSYIHNIYTQYILPLLRGAGPMALMLWLNG
jgi:hypothetical protein